MKKSALIKITAMAACLCLPVIASAQAQLERKEVLMTMPISIQVWARDLTACARALDLGFGEFRRIEQVFCLPPGEHGQCAEPECSPAAGPGQRSIYASAAMEPKSPISPRERLTSPLPASSGSTASARAIIACPAPCAWTRSNPWSITTTSWRSRGVIPCFSNGTASRSISGWHCQEPCLELRQPDSPPGQSAGGFDQCGRGRGNREPQARRRTMGGGGQASTSGRAPAGRHPPAAATATDCAPAGCEHLQAAIIHARLNKAGSGWMARCLKVPGGGCRPSAPRGYLRRAALSAHVAWPAAGVPREGRLASGRWANHPSVSVVSRGTSSADSPAMLDAVGRTGNPPVSLAPRLRVMINQRFGAPHGAHPPGWAGIAPTFRDVVEVHRRGRTLGVGPSGGPWMDAAGPEHGQPEGPRRARWA